jgi:hypothetical protein
LNLIKSIKIDLISGPPLVIKPVCRLSNWSPWSLNFGFGQQARVRSVISAEAGAQCGKLDDVRYTGKNITVFVLPFAQWICQNLKTYGSLEIKLSSFCAILIALCFIIIISIYYTITKIMPKVTIISLHAFSMCYLNTHKMCCFFLFLTLKHLIKKHIWRPILTYFTIAITFLLIKILFSTLILELSCTHFSSIYLTTTILTLKHTKWRKF